MHVKLGKMIEKGLILVVTNSFHNILKFEMFSCKISEPVNLKPQRSPCLATKVQTLKNHHYIFKMFLKEPIKFREIFVAFVIL